MILDHSGKEIPRKIGFVQATRIPGTPNVTKVPPPTTLPERSTAMPDALRP